MKRQVLALALAGGLALSMLGCGSSSEDDSEDATVETEVVSESEVTVETSALESETVQETETATTEEITFESLTVVDNDECSIVITGVNPDGIWGYTLDVELENKSSDVTYMFAVRDASINGVESDPLFATTVAAGKKSVDEIYFTDDDDLIENGIDVFTDIEISFYVYDDDNYTGDYVAEETVHVYPYGEENATTFVREDLETDTVLVDDDNVTVIVTGYELDEIWGYTVNLYLVNKTDTSVMFAVEDASVNGYMSDPFWANSVPAGDCAFSSMSWSESDLEEIGITDLESGIETIEFTLRAYDNETYVDEFVNQTVTLNP